MRSKKPKHHYCEMYKVNIYYFLGWLPKDFYTYAIKHFEIDLDMKRKGGFTLKGPSGDYAIWTCKSDKDKCYLVHECVHTAAWILKDAGVRACFENDEAQAYLTEYIYKKAIT